MISLKDLTIKKLHEMYVSKEVSISEIVSLYKKNIEDNNKDLNIYLEVFNDIDEQVKRAEAVFASGKANFLTGVPIAIKDNLLWQGHRVSAASKMLEDYVATYSSPVVEKLVESGAIIMGRTNMDEFAMGASTENSAYGVTKNPIDNSRVPGGSSGGSAAAVAADMALCAIGSDTGGSIRQPAAFCGVVGMKPTYGTVSRYGLIAMASSLDQIGPFAKNSEDAEILFNFLNFYDKNDSTLIPMDKRVYNTEFKKRIGVPKSFIAEGVDPEVTESFNKTINILKENGYDIVNIDLPLTPLSLAVYYILMPAEVSSNLARFDSIRYGSRKQIESGVSSIMDFYKENRTEFLGKEARRRSILGAFILSHGYYDAYYNKAIKLQKAITKEFVEAFKDVDMVMLPTAPTLPFKIGERSESPLSMYLADLFTAPANIAGLPAISVPVSTSAGLPTGIQIIAPKCADRNLFSLGSEIEKLL